MKKWKNTWRYYQSTHACHKRYSYGVWFLRYWAWRIEFSVILDHSLPFIPANNPKNQNFEKMKKALVDIIILHMCTKPHNHMLNCYWDTMSEGCNSFILDYFLSFYPPPSPPIKPKNQKFLKMKKIPGDIIILHRCSKNNGQVMYDSWKMVRDGPTDGRTDEQKKWHI